MSVPVPGQRVRGSAAGSDPGSPPELARRGIVLIRAPNPGPMTLTGTNTWIVGSGPAWVVDPGPLVEEHVERVAASVSERGGLGGIVLTHDHGDHSGAVAALRERHPAPLAAGRGEAEVRLAEGVRFGPFEALATPGHAPDHHVVLAAGACFTGDAVLGNGSVFISPDPGAMAGYLDALARLRARADIELLCPGHGDVVADAPSRFDEYIAHRLDRERRLVAALAEGKRSTAELLDTVWSEVPAALRPAATATLAAHLDKLEEEGSLPPGVERPSLGERP
jgi:glyoxylase-like metal-dependent hydrolase (beta-lactamase superfamily II)